MSDFLFQLVGLAVCLAVTALAIARAERERPVVTKDEWGDCHVARQRGRTAPYDHHNPLARPAVGTQVRRHLASWSHSPTPPRLPVTRTHSPRREHL